MHRPLDVASLHGEKTSETANPAMRRHAARLILPPVLSAFAAAGCGGDPPGQEAGLPDASAAGADALARPSHLLSPPLRDPDQLPTDGPLLAPGGEAPIVDPLLAVGGEASFFDSLLASGGDASFVDPLPAPGDEAPSGGDCNRNYEPCVPIDSDVDCAGGSGNGPSYVSGPVRVVGSDPYDLDRDGDGVGCDN